MGKIKPENKYVRFIKKSDSNSRKLIVQCKICGNIYEQWQNNYYIEQDPCRCTTKVKNQRLYRTYFNMIHRCYREKQSDYSRYGGCGITVCDEWRNSYKAFETWALNNGYSDDLTIDRIDSSLGYSPDNCRWVDTIFQGNNLRTNIKFVVNWHQASLKRICDVYGLNYKSEHARYLKVGYDETLERLAEITDTLILFYDQEIDCNLPLLREKVGRERVREFT